MPVPKLDRMIGIDVYATGSNGIGGVIRREIEDFVVNEVLADGSVANHQSLESLSSQNVLRSSPNVNRFLLCLLIKRNWDTFLAIRNIANQLGISAARIHIAGIKDAKALTAQHITIENVLAGDIEKIKVKDVKIFTIGYLRGKLSSFYLLGNRFQVNIRSIKCSEQTIRKAVSETLEELDRLGGILNFFGHQRFGTARPITHQVGKTLVKGDLGKAAMLFLSKPSSYEHPESKWARENLQSSQDFKQALNDFPVQLRYERLMLEHLSERPDDFLGAFKRLPVKLRQLFVQGYQSYLFNKFLCKRIKSGLPLNVAEIGDYVISVDRLGLPVSSAYKVVKIETRTEINSLMKEGKVRLALPLIGFKQKPSSGIQGEIEKTILSKERVSLDNFKIAGMPETNARGELRAVLAPIKEFSLDEVSAEPSGQKKCAAKVSFMLQRGSYATVLLREIMKPKRLAEAGF